MALTVSTIRRSVGRAEKKRGGDGNLRGGHDNVKRFQDAFQRPTIIRHCDLAYIDEHLRRLR